MKILLDECLPSRFRHHFSDHEVHTAEWAGMKGLANGDLVRAAEVAGYDVLLTVDKGLPHQQNMSACTLAVIVIRSPTNQRRHLTPFVEQILDALTRIQPGQLVVLRG